MLTVVIAHGGDVTGAHDLWAAWNLDPLVVGGLVALGLLYARGARPRAEGPWRGRAFAGAIGALVVALVSPLDALSEELASAHMVQHVLLVLVAAPLLAVSAPGAALARGSPEVVRRATRAATGPTSHGLVRRLRSPVVRWLLFVATFWLWHASVLYGAAVENDVVHALEHLTFLATALLVWSMIIGPARVRVEAGLGVLAVFTLALQSTFLSALMTFARSPWYEPYLTSTDAWGLDPLADQQLAGVVMWIPAGLVHLGIGLALLAGWLREIDRAAEASPSVS